MLATLLVFYLVVGSASAFSNLGKWIFKSNFIGYLFLPFMTVYFLLFGDLQQRKEALSVLKGFGIIAIIFCFWYLSIITIQAIF